jgi:hypothetical protein
LSIPGEDFLTCGHGQGVAKSRLWTYDHLIGWAGGWGDGSCGFGQIPTHHAIWIGKKTNLGSILVPEKKRDEAIPG